MSSNIFADNAPKHWAAGLPVIPLRSKQKMPAPNSWQSFATQLPDVNTQSSWLNDYPDGNIGLALGPQSGLVALDLDTEDPRVGAVLDKLLPPTPWTRVGKKGSVRLFRYTEERTTRIKGEDGTVICEILSRGTQVVLPPSIHPDTQRPYTANCDLVDVLGQMNPLPRDFETQLRQALMDAGIKLSSRGSVQVTKWVPAGGRDSALVAMAGLLARGVLKGERTLNEALNEAEAWVVNYTENVAGDPMDPAKAREKVMEFVRRDIMEHGRMLPGGWELGMSDQDVLECRKYFGEELEEWTVEDFLNHLTDKFKEIPRENQAARTAIIDDVLNKIAKSQHMNGMEHDVILQFIHNGNSRLITMASMRKRIKELSGGQIVGDDHTQVAKHLIAEIERYGELRWDGSGFFQWAGSHWRPMHDSEILKVLAEEFGTLHAAKKNSDHKGILQIVGHLVPRTLKDTDVIGINFANGFLTLDMELLPHEPAFGCRYVLPYRCEADGGLPLRLFAFLDQCWGQDADYADKVQAFREIIAAILFGVAPKFQRAFCFFGPPKTGKSTASELIQGMLPEDAISTVAPHDWADRFLPTQMVGKLLNFCGEMSEKDLIAGDRFKSIVEGGELNGQLKGGQIFKFRPLCAHLFASNHLPRTRDTSAGFNRRWLFLHFTNMVADGQKVIGLAQQILAEEREAIAAWAVPAILDLMRRQEFTIPQSHIELISDVASQNNSVKAFMTSDVVKVHGAPGNVDFSHRTLEADLYSLYFSYCKVLSNAQPVASMRFRLILQELQSEIGFRITAAGGSDGSPKIVFYDGVTPAERKTR